MDLVLHAGLPKTGTTTIQKHWLAGTPGYLGKDKERRCLSGRNFEARELSYLAAKHRFMSEEEVWERTRKWIEGVRFLAEKNGCDVLTLSQEGLIGWPLYYRKQNIFRRYSNSLRKNPPKRTKPVPLAEYLQRYFLPQWPDDGRVKVVLTLRNQSDWLASHYAQRTTRLVRPSQEDFEETVKDLIERKDPLLDWHATVEALERSLGKENTRVFLFEDMKDADFYLEFMNEFLREDLIKKYDSEDKENVKSSSSPDSWAISPLHKKFFVRNVLTLESARFMRKPLRKIEKILIYPYIIDPLINSKRAREFRMSPEVRNLIQACYAESNMKLSEYLGRDLSKLGY